MNEYRDIVGAARLSNRGTSAGAKKGWETKKASGYMKDAQGFADAVKGQAIKGRTTQSWELSHKASTAAHNAEYKAYQTSDPNDFLAAGVAARAAASAHRNAAAAGSPYANQHLAMAKYHEDRGRDMDREAQRNKPGWEK